MDYLQLTRFNLNQAGLESLVTFETSITETPLVLPNFHMANQTRKDKAKKSIPLNFDLIIFNSLESYAPITAAFIYADSLLQEGGIILAKDTMNSTLVVALATFVKKNYASIYQIQENTPLTGSYYIFHKNRAKFIAMNNNNNNNNQSQNQKKSYKHNNKNK